ncbi:CPL domain protein [Ancylostoma ceylanicum]|uniref:CPL domain protein n=1 Tax=Ancylostoma ceylanicum TaxID=53326 RepID=A0A0D6LEF5_9BILA|nr:CPL domain protein [Ancylostoma ceylanicum]
MREERRTTPASALISKPPVLLLARLEDDPSGAPWPATAVERREIGATMAVMGSQKDKKKKFKGKKKVKNLMEKKAKGLKLNQVDRKRLGRLEEKLKVKAQLRDSVKAELRRLQDQDQENVEEMVSVSPSPPGQSTEKKPNKRVSFSGNMERIKVFDKNVKDLDIKPSSASPGKGILRAKNSKVHQKRKAHKASENSSSPKKVKTDEKVEVESLEDKAAEKPVVAKKKIKIQVTKKVKEQLLTMDRKQRKAFLRQLKAQKNPHSDRAMECKLLWEKIRSKKTTAQERDDCVSKLFGLVKGFAAKLIYAHDTCRVFECLLALKRPGITSAIFDELTPEIVKMTKSKYAHFFVLRMLKYGTKDQRATIIRAFRGHAVSLMRIVYAAEVLECAYNDFANAQQRFDIVSEFYGKQFVMFQSDTPRTLDEIVAEEPSKKKLIIQHLEEQIFTLVDKTTVRLSLCHRLLKDYICHCDTDQRTNLIDSLKDRIPELVHTPDGAYVAMKCIWNANAKDRKLIVKNFKDLTVKVAMEHYGHRVLMAVFDSVDDTVLVNKYITSELSNEMSKLILDTWGEKVIHYVVHPRDGRGMPKEEIELLKEGDSNPFSKKEKKDRYAEIYRHICEGLYTYIAANMETLIFDQNRSKFIAASLETTSNYDLFDRQVPAEMRKQCNEAIAEVAKQEFIPMDSQRLHLIEHPAGHFLLMAVLRCDQSLPEDQQLSVELVNSLNKAELGSWICCNKGCHVLLKMLQCGSGIVRQKIKEAVNMKQLKEYTCRGATLLVQELTKS